MNMEEVRTTKLQAKVQVGRLSSTLRRLLIEQDVAGIQECLSDMKQRFGALEKAHFAHLDFMQDGDDLGGEDKWFQDIMKVYIDSVGKAKKFLREIEAETVVNRPPVPSHSSVSMTSQASVASEIVSAMTLPRVEIGKFDGDPSKYHMFITSFDEIVASRVNDDRTKLSHLMSLLTGEALAAIKPALSLGSSQGYGIAREALRSRFGNVYVVTQAIVQGLRAGKKVTKPIDLRVLSDELAAARNTLDHLSTSHEVDSQTFLREIVDRCNSSIKGKWSKLAISHKESRGAYPTFSDLCDFMAREATRMNDPVYGDSMNKISLASFKAEGAESEKPLAVLDCPICQGPHTLAACPTFRSYSIYQRKEAVKKNRHCYCCLQPGHFVRECSASGCSISGCKRRHHVMLHTRPGDRSEQSDGQRAPVSPADVTVVKAHTWQQDASRVCLPVVAVRVSNRLCYALLDSGSTNSLVTKSLVDSLGLRGKAVSCHVETVDRASSLESRLFDLNLSPIDSGESLEVNNLLQVTRIPADLPLLTVDTNLYTHLQGLPFHKPVKGMQVDILIGMDNPHLLIPEEVRSGRDIRSMPFATKTKLGWALQGPVNTREKGHIRINHLSLQEIDDRVTNLWNIEKDGDEEPACSIQDQRVEEFWEHSVSFSDGHYTLPVPWKVDKPNFPNNLHLAKQRLAGTLRKLQRTGKHSEYDEGIKTMLDSGFAEPVLNDELRGKPGRVWYLPHHGVIHPQKKKLRIVYDCAATCKGISLNTECYQGPDLVNKLLHVLLRFRLYSVAITADVKAMYMQVKLPIEDRDCLRFLWEVEGKINHYRMSSHVFGGIWCASSSTFALRQSLKDNECPEIVERAVCKDMYVDDLLSSVPTVAEGRELASGTSEVLAKGGFRLTKFLSNYPEALKDIPEGDRTEESKDISEQTNSKVLGLQWNVRNDDFTYRPIPSAGGQVTKRSMLSEVSSLYDPLGLVSPIILLGRLLFQEATRLKLEWDQNVPDDLATRWHEWVMSLSDITKLTFPRCLIPSKFLSAKAELHHFCDGSMYAYGTCTYFRLVSASGDIRVTLLVAKSRVAPVKSTTIPRLELSAANLAVQQDIVLRRELSIDLSSSTFWSDSQVVLAYIASDSRRFKVFVANRVAFIRRNTEVSQWKYINTKSNPADIASRGSTSTKLPSCWIGGPDFLSQPEDTWVQNEVSVEVPEDDHEVKKSEKLNLVSVSEKPVVNFVSKLVSHYSSMYRLCKAVSWWRRFLQWLRDGRPAVPQEQITAAEIASAERQLVRLAQQSVYDDDIIMVSKGGHVKRSSTLVSLDPVLKDYLLCVGGRLKHSQALGLEKHPVILPPKHVVTTLLLQQFHQRGHTGVEWTASLVGERFWVPKLRSQLKSIRRHCLVCKRRFDFPMVQKMADLPEDRCSPPARPFQEVGVDLFGPFLVRQGRATVKRYGCIFSCPSSRAVHLEVLHSLEADSFLNSLVRFCARRGRPQVIRSDNGRNFVGATAELAREFKLLDKDSVIRGARSRGIDWRFNPPYASHFGGVWERLIRVVRRVLVAIINPGCVLTDETLVTVMCEVEGLVNSRPLTKVSDDPLDMAPLTPNHLLRLDGVHSWIWADLTAAENSRRRWRRVQAYVKMFWARWIKEYLPSLQKRTKWYDVKMCPKVGDLVLVVDELSDRGSWPVGVITEVHHGRDNLVRSARIRTKSAELVRPITKLVSLELDSS